MVRLFIVQYSDPNCIWLSRIRKAGCLQDIYLPTKYAIILDNRRPQEVGAMAMLAPLKWSVFLRFLLAFKGFRDPFKVFALPRNPPPKKKILAPP